MSDTVAVMSDGMIVQCGTPRAVYEKPANEFIANFLGAANILYGTLLERQGNEGLISIDGGAGTLRVNIPDGLRLAERVCLVFRPEDTVLQSSEDTGNSICGLVTRLSFQGGTTECLISVSDRSIRVLVHPLVEVLPGARAWIKLNPSRCVFYPAS
jgi:iron(III) transport system ATP-binding protein